MSDSQVPEVVEAHFTLWCTLCREYRPQEQWIGLDFGPDDTPMCRRCRETGPPPMDPFAGYAQERDRKMVAMILRGDSNAQIAAACGLSTAQVISIRAGRSKPVVRNMIQYLLEKQGIDIFTIARKTAQLLEHKRAQWNPKDGEWNEFDDGNVQLGALKHAAKLHDLEPPKDSSVVVPVQVNFHTNFADPTEPREVAGSYRVKRKAGKGGA